MSETAEKFIRASLLGVASIEEIEEIVAKMKIVAERYKVSFDELTDYLMDKIANLLQMDKEKLIFKLTTYEN